jgi:diguanylate cyclase (GGDEF)-like protein
MEELAGVASEIDERTVRTLFDALASGATVDLDSLLVMPPWGDGRRMSSSAAGVYGSFVAAMSTAEHASPGTVFPLSEVTGRLGSAISKLQAETDAELQNLITIDELTGCLTRRALLEAIDREVDRAKRHNRSLSILYMDVDGLKAINDSRGHATGDAVLAGITKTVRGNVRSSDIVGRIGGDEFIVVLPDTDRSGGETAANKLIQVLGAAGFSVSIGVAGTPYGALTRNELLEAADRGLRMARDSDGNRVSASE